MQDEAYSVRSEKNIIHVGIGGKSHVFAKEVIVYITHEIYIIRLISM